MLRLCGVVPTEKSRVLSIMYIECGKWTKFGTFVEDFLNYVLVINWAPKELLFKQRACSGAIGDSERRN